MSSKEYYKQYNLKHRKERLEKSKNRSDESRNGWRRKNLDIFHAWQKKYRIKNQYGITLQEAQELLVSQGNKCALCQIPLEEAASRSGGQIDHDHKSGIVRGILCTKCNIALGYLEYFLDSPDRLKNAMEYLGKK